MFREMRRKKQQLTKEACDEILSCGTSGVLALSGDGGYPYAVPLSYVYSQGKIYFHCATSGHKIDAINQDPKASFCVIGQDQVIPEKYTTCYRSVIVFGTVRILEDDQEKMDAVKILAEKYSPHESPASRQDAIQKDWDRLCMLELTVEHLTGKECIELVRQRNESERPVS